MLVCRQKERLEMKLFKLYIMIVLICLIFGVGNSFSHKLEDFNLDEVSYEEVEKEKSEVKLNESKSDDEKEDVPTNNEQSISVASGEEPIYTRRFLLCH